MENGIYDAKYAGHFDFSSNRDGDKQCILVDMELIDSEEIVTVQLWMSEKAIEMTEKKLSALGWKGKPHQLDASCTNVVKVRIKDDDYKGVVTQKADIMAGGMGLRITPFSPMSTAQRNDAHKRLFGALAAANGAKKPAPKVEKSDADDSEIPF